MPRLLKPILLLFLCFWALPLAAQTSSAPSPSDTPAPTETLTSTPTATETLTVMPEPTLTATATFTTTSTSTTPPTETPEPTLTPTFAPPTRTPVPTATAAPVFPIRPGSIEGNINDAVTSVRYSFEARRDDSVTIGMGTTSGDLDPFLSLFGPDGTLIGRNDDEASGSRNSTIALTLSQGGTYVIEATRFPEGTSIGTFRLTLAIAGTQTTDPSTDPLSTGPDFAVQFTTLAYGDTEYGEPLNEANPRRYFAIGGQQGDLVRVVVTSSTDLLPQIRILNRNSEALSRESETRPGENLAYATLPEAGWYLVEVTALSGTGTFNIFVNRLASAVLQVGAPLTGEFTSDIPLVSYIINARIGDQLTVTLFTEIESSASPQIRLLDLNLNEIEGPASGQRFATLRTRIPRSGPYVLQASNLSPQSSGSFNLRLTSDPADTTELNIMPVSYNKDYPAAISSETALQYYRFAGKTGDLVTITMSRESDDLDPYLILMDSDLNELTANNDASINTRDARITQFRLPKDGDYYIVATHNDLTRGATTGTYNLAITAGAISLESGAFTATLRWSGAADLNLFVRDPLGRTISWSDPASPSGGVLQIDSNTGCQTPGAEPIEHVYWDDASAVAGDYEIWVWYQNGCGREDTVTYSLAVNINGTSELNTSGELSPRQRYEAGIRVTDEGETGITNTGRVTTPTAQQEASEGGDIFVRYGENVVGTISSDRYALFYQFNGTAGDQVRIQVEQLSETLDPVVILRDADNRTLPDAINDDADSSTHNSLLTYTLPSDGEYIISVTRFGVRDGITTGDFRMTLEQITPP